MEKMRGSCVSHRPAPSEDWFPGPSGLPTRRGQLLLMLLGGVCLLSGLNTVVRLAVWAPVASDRVAAVHGMVMVLGFLGTLISLERAQSLGRTWGYLAPALYGAGGLCCSARRRCSSDSCC